MFNFISGIKVPSSSRIFHDYEIPKRQINNKSCASFAIISAIEYLLKKSKYLTDDHSLSEDFLFKNNKSVKDIESVLQYIFEKGIVSQKVYFNHLNQDQIYQDASKHKITSYHQIEITEYNLKVALSNKYPVIFVMAYSDQSFSLLANLYTGIAGKSGLPLKYQHASVLVGYNEIGFIFKNSWDGVIFHWGDHGYGYIPYQLMSTMITKGWIISKFTVKHQLLTQSLQLQNIDRFFN